MTADADPAPYQFPPSSHILLMGMLSDESDDVNLDGKVSRRRWIVGPRFQPVTHPGALTQPGRCRGSRRLAPVSTAVMTASRLPHSSRRRGGPVRRARDELLHAMAMDRPVLVAVGDPLLASQNGPVWVERSQLSRREVVDPLAFLHVDGAIGEDDVGVEAMPPRDGLEPGDEFGPHGPRHVVDGAARVDEIEALLEQGQRVQAADVATHPAHPHPSAAR